MVGRISPPLILWGLFCAGVLIARRRSGRGVHSSGPEGFAVSIIPVRDDGGGGVAHRDGPDDQFAPAACSCRRVYWSRLRYVLIWMFNGKRSHSLIGVLATVCAFYISRLKRPSWPVLIAPRSRVRWSWRSPSAGGTIAITSDRSRDSSTISAISRSQRFSRASTSRRTRMRADAKTYETVEYGGFLLLMDTVPAKSDYDYGENYLRVVSTFIPRVLWPGKPLYGRSQWVNAWIAGSELERDEDFTGPAIGILGAAQLNGGAIGTLIVLALHRFVAPHRLRVSSASIPTSRGSSSGGRSFTTMPGSWSSATILSSGFTITGDFRRFRSSSSFGGQTGRRSRCPAPPQSKALAPEAGCPRSSSRERTTSLTADCQPRTIAISEGSAR